MQHTLTMLQFRELTLELKALKAFAARTNQDLRAMIDVVPADRERLAAFISANPSDERWVTYALGYRDAMLAILDQEEEDARERAA